MDYLIVSGLMTGVTEEEMAPEAMMDRASAIAMLYRAAGSPDMTGGVPFLDAVPGSYYFAGVAWAWDRGITAGVSANSFAPMALLNREQLVTFLYRFAGDAGLDTSAAADLTDCADVLSVSPFALDPMRWAVGTGLIDSGPVLDPLNPLTRSQAGKLIWRFLAYIG